MSGPERHLDPRALERVRAVFEPEREYLRGVAYRMLGSLSDAQDVVQDAFLRLTRVDPDSIEHPRAYLAQLVTRLCVDVMRSARVRREHYVGPWLPEPLVVEDQGFAAGPDEAVELREDVSLALMVALERLSPLERAAFILHDVFDVDYAEVAAALGRDPAACRQLAARGRSHVQAARPRFRPSPEQANALLGAFMGAVASGDLDGLQRLLAADVTVTTDGGGVVSAATKVVRGPERAAKFLIGIARKFYVGGAAQISAAQVNGQHGFVVREGGRVTQAMAIDIRDQVIAGLYTVRNPDKLRHLN